MSQSLRKLIQNAKPTKTFRELQVDTEISLPQLYRLSAHLVHWNQAKIINALTKTNIYVINPKAPIEDRNYYVTLTRQFTMSFPNFRLNEVLERFSFAKTLGEHIDILVPSLQRDFVDIAIWLLQRNLLIQLHKFIYLVIPGANIIANLKEQIEDTYPFHSAPIPLQPHELEVLEELHESGPAYERLLRYC